MEASNDKKPEELIELGRLNELRLLVTGLSQSELERLQRLIRDPHEFASEISDLLPYSIRKLIEKGEITVDELQPFVEDAMHKSVQKNPTKLADILFPVMGPAIRKAVSEDLKKMIASVNDTIESGISPKSLKWRFQALLSKRSYAEIVVANTYIYHVRHVFLIHRKTGLLLHEEAANEKVELEADMISSMLTAIRDFVQDSFSKSGTGSLDEIQVGNLNILVEQGPYAILAAIIDGEPPADYRYTLIETIEAVHFNHATDLENFKGDTTIFEHTAKFLRNCLINEKKEKAGKVPWPLIFIMLTTLGLAATFFYFRYEKTQHFNSFIAQLDALPGYHITKIEHEKGKNIISGLADYQAESFDELLQKFEQDSSKMVFNLEPYISLEKEIVLKRANSVVNPPESVSLDYQLGVLYASGTASQDWIEQAKLLVGSIDGVAKLDITNLNKEKIDLRWIIPAIEKYNFVFDVNIVSLNEQQQIQFDSLVLAAVHLDAYNKLYNKNMAIYVRSFTKRNENVDANIRVAIQRAEGFVGLLKNAGLGSDLLEAQVTFAENEYESFILRSVHFEVFEKEKK